MCALGVVGFIRGRWVQSGAHCGSLGSSGVVGFTRVGLGDPSVHPGSLGSLVCALGVVECTRVPPAGRWVHSGAPCESLCPSLDVVFACVRPGIPLVHPGLLGSLGCSLRFVGFVWGR